MTHHPAPERTIVVHQAGSWTEAVVIRGLLESAGIASPASTTTDPFPMREPPQGIHGVEIIVLESQAEEARGIIRDYLDSSASILPEDSSEAERGEDGTTDEN
jgi:hypothetical protein